MPEVAVPAARHTVRDELDSLQFSIPSRKNWFAVLFLPFWLIGWAFGEVSVIGALVSSLTSDSGASSIPYVFMLAWLGGWTVGGGFVIYTLLWQLAGKEIVDIRPQSIETRRTVFGYGIPKVYRGDEINDLRVSPPNYSAFDWSRGMQFWGLTGGWIAFDYGSKTVRFASGVDEAEAKQIVALIRERFPHYSAIK